MLERARLRGCPPAAGHRRDEGLRRRVGLEQVVAAFDATLVRPDRKGERPRSARSARSGTGWSRSSTPPRASSPWSYTAAYPRRRLDARLPAPARPRRRCRHGWQLGKPARSTPPGPPPHPLRPLNRGDGISPLGKHLGLGRLRFRGTAPELVRGGAGPSEAEQPFAPQQPFDFDVVAESLPGRARHRRLLGDAQPASRFSRTRRRALPGWFRGTAAMAPPSGRRKTARPPEACSMR
jgi:hypothetical protein